MLIYKAVNKLLQMTGQRITYVPKKEFHSPQYQRINARRLEHLASLGIQLGENVSVLDVGAGIGDLSSYYIDRGHQVTIADGRETNLKVAREIYPDVKTLVLDMETPCEIPGSPFDVVHCYGLLYHLSNPSVAVEFLSRNSKRLVFIETCVSFGEESAVNTLSEDKQYPSQALSGTGCRPTRRWVYEQLKAHFDFVYIPRTQPNHTQFPIDWDRPEQHEGLSRAIFIASRVSIENPLLSSNLLQQQVRHH